MRKGQKVKVVGLPDDKYNPKDLVGEIVSLDGKYNPIIVIIYSFLKCFVFGSRFSGI